MLELFSRGSGTLTDPYILSTADDIYNIRFKEKGHYMLDNSINLLESTCNDATGWVPIPIFSGSLDGNGFSISGLFGSSGIKNLITVLEGHIRNIQFDSVNITGNTGSSVIAQIMNHEGAIIENCSISGSISSTNGRLGGFVYDFTRGLIKNCVSYINFNSTGICGGIANIVSTLDTVYTPRIDKCIYHGDLGTNTNSGGILGSSTHPINITESFYNTQSAANNTFGDKKDDIEIKEASLYVNWNDSVNKIENVWVILDGIIPILYFNSNESFIIKTIDGYFTFRDNIWVNIGTEEPSENDFVLHGLSGADLSNIPGARWNDFRNVREFELYNMSNSIRVDKNRISIPMTFLEEGSEGLVYTADIDLSLYGDSISKISVDKGSVNNG